MQCSRKLQKACSISDALWSLRGSLGGYGEARKSRNCPHKRLSRIGGPESTSKSESKEGKPKTHFSEKGRRNEMWASSEGG